MITFVLAALGTLGIGGFIALAIFAPPIAAQVAKIAFDLLNQMLATRWGVGLLVAIVCLTFGNFYFDHRGAARVQAKWDAAERAAVKRGEDARAEAEKEIPPVADDQPAAAAVPEKPASPSIFHLPFHFPKAPDATCPPTVAATCDAPARGPMPDWMRNDKFRRNER